MLTFRARVYRKWMANRHQFISGLKKTLYQIIYWASLVAGPYWYIGLLLSVFADLLCGSFHKPSKIRRTRPLFLQYGPHVCSVTYTSVPYRADGSFCSYHDTSTHFSKFQGVFPINKSKRKHQRNNLKDKNQLLIAEMLQFFQFCLFHPEMTLLSHN